MKYRLGKMKMDAIRSVIRRPDNFRHFYPENQFYELALEAVKADPYMLQEVREDLQTPEICLEAVKRRGFALQYVLNQTEEVCLEAVRNDGTALRFVETQTALICSEAIKQNEDAKRYITIPIQDVYRLMYENEILIG